MSVCFFYCIFKSLYLEIFGSELKCGACTAGRLLLKVENQQIDNTPGTLSTLGILIIIYFIIFQC
jgi:hypothetical protein